MLASIAGVHFQMLAKGTKLRASTRNKELFFAPHLSQILRHPKCSFGQSPQSLENENEKSATQTRTPSTLKTSKGNSFWDLHTPE